MKVKTEPSLPEIEQKLSGKEITQDRYREALEMLEDQKYAPTGMLLRRAAIPKFPVGVPLKILADWDPQLHESDVVIKLDKKMESDNADKSGRRVRLSGRDRH